MVSAEPSSEVRGKRLAAIANQLEMARDYAWHFGLEKPLGSAEHKRLGKKIVVCDA
jgi:hypothetical protein